MEEREICNARIAPNTPWKMVASTSPAPQARPSYCTTAPVTARSLNQPKKWDIYKSTPINRYLAYNRWQCGFWKRYVRYVQTCTNKRETLNDLNNRIQLYLNNIINSGQVHNGWEDWDKDFLIAQWIDHGSEMKKAYQAYIKACAIWKDIYASSEKSRKNMKNRNGFWYVQNLNIQWRLVLLSTFNVGVIFQSRKRICWKLWYASKNEILTERVHWISNTITCAS